MISLTAREYAHLLLLFETILPQEGPLPPGKDAPSKALVEDVFRHAPLFMRVGIRGALWLTWCTPPLTVHRPSFFGSLTAAQREAHLSALASSDFYAVRELPNLLKMLACMSWGAQPSVQRAVGMRTTDHDAPRWSETKA